MKDAKNPTLTPQLALAILKIAYREAHKKTGSPKQIRRWAERKAYQSYAVMFSYSSLCGASGPPAPQWWRTSRIFR